MAGEDNGTPSYQGKHDKCWPPYDTGARIISYNLSEGERPSGVRIRYKIRIVTGRQADTTDRQQADAIRDYLRWVRQYRHDHQEDTA